MKLPKNLEVDLPSLCHVLGVSQPRVSQLVATGVLTQRARNAYPLARNVRAFIAYKHPADDASPNAKLIAEKTKAYAIRNAEAARRLVDVEEANAFVDSVIARINGELEGLPATFTRNLDERLRLGALLDGVRTRVADHYVREAGIIKETGRLPDDPVEEEDDESP
jgi:hypothetical protein